MAKRIGLYYHLRPGTVSSWLGSLVLEQMWGSVMSATRVLVDAILWRVVNLGIVRWLKDFNLMPE